MFDSYSTGPTKQYVHINAVSGAILKNHPKSWFKRFHLQSNYANKLLTEGGHAGGTTSQYNEFRGRYEDIRDEGKDIIVLQMIICGDMEVIAECVYRKDFECSEREK